jgi:alpha-tubulin suppressor-like RCC1 family protein
VFAVSEPQGFASLALGQNQTCYARANGTARCVGINSYGNLGTNNTTAAPNWVDMTVVNDIKKIEMSGTTTCVLTNSGGVQCFGYSGDDYQLGNSSVVSSRTPKTPTGLASGVADMSFNEGAGCAMMNSGQVLCWGRGDEGRMGDNSVGSNRYPGPVTTTETYNSLSVGGQHVCALRPTGKADCWGTNSSGQLGNGTTTAKYVPTLVE